MKSVEISILVSYSQVTVFDHSLERPFNQWTEKHVAQGFSWRPRSAAFRTIAEGGQHIVTVAVDVIENGQSPDAVRIIEVPFEVPADGTIEIGSISDSYILEIPAGIYKLRFECYEPVSSKAARIRFLFVRDTNPKFRIVRADPDLSPENELLLTTSAA
ncbi:competence protein ComJ [Roseixanthobacter pseudopolyaromaticivorans]|uniref:competence protein ComJ n=1 Tax=Xanthobacteraceae TaxID=335928 RepID=UPI0037293B49